jgi:hypothetical protein
MRWRFWAAGLVLAVGFIVWAGHLLDETDRWSPKPGHWSFPTYNDAAFSKMAAQSALPRSGVIGYRDELFDPDPPEQAREGMHSAFRGMVQYTLAPVILDEGSPHQQTLVLTRDRTFQLERRQPAGEP